MTNKHALAQVDIFQDLKPEHLNLIEEICQEVTYQPGEVVFEENDPSREFYIILEGEIEIKIDPDTIGAGENDYQPSTIAVLRWGQSFGEVTIVDPAVRSASAACGSEKTCRLLMIKREDFMKLLLNDTEMGFIVMRNFAVDLALKIRQTNLMVRESLMG